MRASLEIHSGTIRVHPGDGAYGDPYEWSCTVTLTPDGVAWLSGVDRPVTPAIWRAVRRLLAEHGVKGAVWGRRKDGCVRRVRVSLA